MRALPQALTSALSAPLVTYARQVAHVIRARLSGDDPCGADADALAYEVSESPRRIGPGIYQMTVTDPRDGQTYTVTVERERESLRAAAKQEVA